MSRLSTSIIEFIRKFVADASSNTPIKHGLVTAALSVAIIAAIGFLGDEIVAALGRLGPEIDVSLGADPAGGLDQNP